MVGKYKHNILFNYHLIIQINDSCILVCIIFRKEIRNEVYLILTSEKQFRHLYYFISGGVDLLKGGIVDIII
jgi:hypothetical protein